MAQKPTNQLTNQPTMITKEKHTKKYVKSKISFILLL